jgi:signal transduction histidine kinase
MSFITMPIFRGGRNLSTSSVPQNDGSGSTPIPKDAAPLESILFTEELYLRQSRPPDYERENRALVTLARALADSPRTILQTLADTILDVSQAGSAGISLLSTDDGGKRFYWPAIAGCWKAHIGGGTPRDFGPCGDVLDRNSTLLFRHVERRYTYFKPVTPLVEECLLVPFYVAGKAVGTIWAVAHDQHLKFDAEDERLMTSLGKFASSAYQILASLDALKFQVTEREAAEAALRGLAGTLEKQVRDRTEQIVRRNTEALKQSERFREVSHRLMQAQDEERRRIARELHDSAGQIVAALGMKLATIKEDARRGLPTVVPGAEDGQRLVDQLSQEIRTMSYLLHPPLLDETGLPGTLHWYIGGLSDRSGLDISLDISDNFGRLANDMELVIFRVVQECLTNVHRHSESETAMIRLSREGERVVLEVQDEGKGMSPERLSEIQSQGSGVGIAGMRERIRPFNGEMNIHSNGRGTRISVVLFAARSRPQSQGAIRQVQAAG